MGRLQIRTQNEQIESNLGCLYNLLWRKVRKEENANFVRQKPDNDGKGGNNKTRVKMYQTTVKEKQKGKAHGYNRPHPDRARPPHPAKKSN